VTTLVQLRKHLGNALEGAGQRVVMQALIISVRAEDFLELGVGIDVLAHLRIERRPDAGNPFLVSGCPSRPASEGVPDRAEEQLERVDERSVEVKEDGGKIRRGHMRSLTADDQASYGYYRWRRLGFRSGSVRCSPHHCRLPEPVAPIPEAIRPLARQFAEKGWLNFARAPYVTATVLRFPVSVPNDCSSRADELYAIPLAVRGLLAMSIRTHQMVGAAVAALSVLAMAPHQFAAQGAQPFVIRGARVFDGQRMLGETDVLVRDGVIAWMGREIQPPADAAVVDGRGKTLLPGFIDSHTHAFADALRDAIVFGVTTELDMFTSYQMAAAMRAEQAAGQGADRADLRSAGTLVTAPKGHGTEYGMVIPTITAPNEAQAFVDARIAEGSDYIKIVYDDGHTFGRQIPTLDKATLKAVIDAAHIRHKMAVVHISDQTSAREAIGAGADGLVHIFNDRAPDADFATFVRSHRAFVIPTLSVEESVSALGGGATLVTDARLAPFISPDAARGLRTGFPKRPSPPYDFSYGLQAVRQLKAAGVPILAGTDAPNPGTAHGASIHRELELLVRAGLTPVEALAAATSVPAERFALGDRGLLARGRRADFVLVNGDPTTDILRTRDIVGVWKRGVAIDRDGYRASVEKAKAASAGAPRPPSGLERGVVSDFDDGTAGAGFGSGWAVSTDDIADGSSSATMKVMAGGANGSAGALSVAGTIVGPLPYAWAGVMFSPGSAPFTPANLSSAKAVSFWTKGDGKRYRIMIFSQSRGQIPLVQSFDAGAEWKEITFPLAAFDGIDGHDVMGIVFAGGPQPGAFAFQIDGVRIR
jgi:imidazolonepropionase-like amidohydrolase